MLKALPPHRDLVIRCPGGGSLDSCDSNHLGDNPSPAGQPVLSMEAGAVSREVTEHFQLFSEDIYKHGGDWRTGKCTSESHTLIGPVFTVRESLRAHRALGLSFSLLLSHWLKECRCHSGASGLMSSHSGIPPPHPPRLSPLTGCHSRNFERK